MRFNRGAWLFVAFTLCWSLTEIFAAQTGVTLYEVVWMRYGIHIAAMLLVFGPKAKGGLVRSPHLGQQIGRSLLMLGMPILLIVAMSRMPLNDAFDLMWVSPILLILFDRFFTREGRGWLIPVVTVVGFVGILLIIHPKRAFGLSMALPIGTAACLAAYILMTRSMRDQPVLPKMFHTALWVFLAMTPFVPFFWQPVTLHNVLEIAGVALFGWVTLFLLDRSTDDAPPALLAPILYSVVIWSELFQWLATGAAPDKTAIAGTVLVLGAIATALVTGKAAARGVPQAPRASHTARSTA